jgi:hypothetical protein
VVLRPEGRPGLPPGRSAADDALALEALARPHDDVHSGRGRREREPLGAQQQRHAHDAAGHDPAQSGAGRDATERLADPIDGIVHFEAFLTPWTIFYLDPESTHTFQVKARDYFGNTVESNVLSVTTPPKTDNVAPTAPTNLQFSSETAPPELWLTWNQSMDDTDSASLILYETYLNGVLVPDGVVGGTNTIAYCRDVGPTTVVLKAVDTSGNRSGPSNELNIIC